MKEKFKSYIKRIIKLISLEEMRILPGHLAFNIVLMIDFIKNKEVIQ